MQVFQQNNFLFESLKRKTLFDSFTLLVAQVILIEGYTINMLLWL